MPSIAPTGPRMIRARIELPTPSSATARKAPTRTPEATATSGAYCDWLPSASSAGPIRAPSAAPPTKPASGSALAIRPR